MMYKTKHLPGKARALHIMFLFTIVFLAAGCGKKESAELYHRFPDKSWARFNLLSFEIPVKKVTSYNIYLFARFEPGFQYETLDFNMIMNTPAGEERINEYRMDVKTKSGDFCIECDKDSCMGTIMLKKEIYLSKPGVLKIEIENLTPRITTECVLGVGIRLVPSGK
jgi:gliding motility-associated lipoprotein GldH